MEQKRENRILELDGLRAFAVMLVVFHHMMNFGGSLPKPSPLVGHLLAAAGQAGVSVFFVISGFIITSLLLREKAAAGRVSLPAFYIRRFFRIVPPFATYLLVVLALGALGCISIAPRDVLWSALFLFNLGFGNEASSFVSHTWSLAVEEQFYLFFPPFLCLLAAFRKRLTVVVLLVVFFLSLGSLKLAHELTERIGSWGSAVAGLNAFRYIIVGVLLALVGEGVRRRLTGTWRLVPAVLCLAIIGARIAPRPSPLLTLIFDTLEPVCCGLLVMWFMQNPNRCATLRWPIFQWLGACSYSIYLWQQLFTSEPGLYHGWSLAQSPWSLVAIIGCAALSHYLIERPSIRLGRRFSQRKQAAAGS